jgi:Lrp/AsnC family transcriptional regulator
MENIIDDADRRILRELQRDSSQAVTQLAEKVGLSQAPCWRRIQKLRQAGIIKQEVALLDQRELGWQLELFVQIKLRAHGGSSVDEYGAFTAAMREHEQVIGCYVLLGSVDVLLHVVARDVADYERFFAAHLSRAPGVQEANSMIVMTQVKHSTALPV